MEALDTLLSIAVDLTASLSAKDRYHRLLEALGQVIPYDAAALMRIDGDLLIPMAARGLSQDAMGRQYARGDHPRLDIICGSRQPVRFPADNALPDPFDGLLVKDQQALGHIHACLGCPLRVGDRLVGVLTADALDPRAFEHLQDRFLEMVGALAGAQMQTAGLIDALERNAERQGQIASDLMQDIHMRQGSQILGGSAVMAHLRREIDLVAHSDFTVLVLGETGVGKELVVRAIHKASERRDGPMLYLNCAALPETLAESELFGHVKGAFTGAGRDRAGKFELADGGTLFLDEIGELPLPIQPKLLRAIQEGEIQRIGSDQAARVDVRLLAATNRSLEAEVERGRFRADLFHRLNVYPIHVPPLRERTQDIPLLAGCFCEHTQRRLGLGPVRLDPEALDALCGYSWPGNVRELENVISRAVLKASAEKPRGDQINVGILYLGGDLAAPIKYGPPPPSSDPVFARGFSLRAETKKFQRRMIQRALARHGGNWARSARDLGMHRSNLHTLASRLGLR
jgi:anaerobic nitric oxide reductase transcription regulator